MKLKKGDKIIVLLGKDKGRTGKIEKFFKKRDAVLVPGLNIYKRHMKRQSEKNPGGIIDVPRPIKASKVALVCPKCNLKTRVGFDIEKEAKVRICRKCQKKI